MVTFKCSRDKLGNNGKYGCNCEYELDEKAIIHDREISCPVCGRISNNPLWDGGSNPTDYIG